MKLNSAVQKEELLKAERRHILQKIKSEDEKMKTIPSCLSGGTSLKSQSLKNSLFNMTTETKESELSKKNQENLEKKFKRKYKEKITSFFFFWIKFSLYYFIIVD
jgi:hypothetical protein